MLGGGGKVRLVLGKAPLQITSRANEELMRRFVLQDVNVKHWSSVCRESAVGENSGLLIKRSAAATSTN